MGLGPHHIDVELKEVDRNSSIAAADAIDKEILGDSYGEELLPISEESKENENWVGAPPSLKKCSSQQIARLHYHIDNNHDMEAKVINSNVEFVRMGILKERAKEKDRKSSGMVLLN